MDNNPFVHVPHLQERLIPIAESKVRVTPQVLAQWDVRVRAMGGTDGWCISENEREASRCATLEAIKLDQDVWVFAYGSLMWDPAIYFAEVRHAQLTGYRRVFNYQVMSGRGTPEQPGLVLSIMPSTAHGCQGLAFRIAPDQVEQETTLLWRREMLRGGYCPMLLTLHTPQGDVQGLVFAGNPAHSTYVQDLSLDETAAVVACAGGYLGPNRDYLNQLDEQLCALGIQDDYILGLSQRVACL